MSGKKLSPAELSLLHEAQEYGTCRANTEYERGLIDDLFFNGYLDSDSRITRLGRSALKGQNR